MAKPLTSADPGRPRPAPYDPFPVMAATVTAAIVVGGIYLGRPILVPLSLAVLMAFALAPLVGLLRDIHLGRVPSVILSVLLAVVIILGLAGFIGAQFANLAADLPRYQTNLLQKIEAVRGTAAQSSVVQGVSAVLKKLSDEVTGTSDNANAPKDGNGSIASDTAQAGKPVPVEIVNSQTEPLQVIENILEPLLEPLATLAVVIIFVAFILLQKEDLRDRFIRLAGAADLQRTTLALDEAATKLARYLFLQTIINLTFGMIVAVGLYLVGIPNSGLWGLVGAMLRYVPYVGVPLAAAFPVALSLAIAPGWITVVWTLAVFFVTEPIIGQVVEPYLYGRHMGLSAVAVIVAAAFWTWVWGPVGLILSTPLTMCLVVIGRHVPHLQFLDVLLGDAPPLAQEESFYSRMLAGDADEAVGQAEQYLKSHSLFAYFDGVALKGLTLAQHDVDRGVLDEEHRLGMRVSVQAFLDELWEREKDERDDEEEAARLEAIPAEWRDGAVLCIAGRGALDEAAAAMLAYLLRRHGIGARVISAEDAAPGRLHRIAPEGVQVVCASYLDPDNYKNARYLIRRVRKRFTRAEPIACFWGFQTDDARYLDSIEATESDVVTSLRSAVGRIVRLVHRGPGATTADESSGGGETFDNEDEAEEV